MNSPGWDKLLKQGIFAALFISLLIYTIQENAKREAEYQRTIQEVTQANSKYADLIKIDLATIEAKIGK